MTKQMICSIDSCGNAGRITLGLCATHYQRMRRHGDPNKTVIKVTRRGEAAAFFENEVLNCVSDECLIWPFNKTEGRGQIRKGGKNYLVSRLACIEIYGTPPDGYEAAHSCGKGHLGCVNPKHLRWAAHSENEADKIGHGTSQHGERNNMAKLSDAQVAQIRDMAGDHTHKAISEIFGVSRSSVGLILQGLRR